MNTTDSNESILPNDLVAWIAATANAEVTGITRHNARREAWRVETRTPSGATQRHFLRIDRWLAEGRSFNRNLYRETALIETLAKHGIPAQRILGWNDKHCAALQSWVPGAGELNLADPAEQHSVMLDFMAIIAKMHRIDISTLNLPQYVIPLDPLQHSLLELEAVEERGMFPVSACAINPLAAFGKRWLINHAPRSVPATVLLQGDTGPANFLYEKGRVTALVDWEWGHYGDPMEDLGNIWTRDFCYPSSNHNLAPYFEHYAKVSGFELDFEKIFYYRVHQLVRSVIGLVYLTDHLDWKTPIPLNLGYRAMIDIETCRAIAEASGIDFEQASRPGVTIKEDPNSLYVALAEQQEKCVVPHLTDAFAKSLSQGHAETLRYLDRRNRHGEECDALELAGIRSLLGNDVADLDNGRLSLIKHIEQLDIADETPVLNHLCHVAGNQAVLMHSLMKPWLDRRWASITPK